MPLGERMKGGFLVPEVHCLRPSPVSPTLHVYSSSLMKHLFPFPFPLLPFPDWAQGSSAAWWCDWSQFLQWRSGRLLWNGRAGPALPLSLLFAAPRSWWSPLERPRSPLDNLSAVKAHRAGLGRRSATATGCWARGGKEHGARYVCTLVAFSE